MTDSKDMLAEAILKDKLLTIRLLRLQEQADQHKREYGRLKSMRGKGVVARIHCRRFKALKREIHQLIAEKCQSIRL